MVPVVVVVVGAVWEEETLEVSYIVRYCDLLGLTACRCAFESAVRPVLSPVAGIKAHNRFTSGSEAAQLAECFSPQIVDILLSLYSQAKN